MGKHVLVVDDDPNILQTVTEILRFEDCCVAEATNGAEALEKIEESPPAVVLLDMRMPVLDGWGVARALKERGIEVPVVVMTAAQDARRWCEEIGGAACLAKPFDVNDLLDTVALYAQCPPA